MNLPNKLTVLRVLLVPVFLIFLTVQPLYAALGDRAARLCAAGIFLLASLTDMLDGKIARKYNLITDFGKFMDPLPPKLFSETTTVSSFRLTSFHRRLAETRVSAHYSKS